MLCLFSQSGCKRGVEQSFVCILISLLAKATGWELYPLNFTLYCNATMKSTTNHWVTQTYFLYGHTPARQDASVIQVFSYISQHTNSKMIVPLVCSIHYSGDFAYLQLQSVGFFKLLPLSFHCHNVLKHA